jgi:phospholipase C
MRKILAAFCAAALFTSTLPTPAFADNDHDRDRDRDHKGSPIKHLIVIFDENISYDHYFGTYPNAENNSGETPFHADKKTPRNNNLIAPLDPNRDFSPLRHADFLNKNPNGPNGSGAAANGLSAANPFRLAPSQAATADQGHNYKPEQMADDNGLMDLFPVSTGTAGPPPSATNSSNAALTKGLTMGYFDGNTVTALWNYAQHFVLFDNTYTTTFGPSTPGAVNLISGQTNGFSNYTNVISNGALLHATHEAFDNQGGFTMIGDADPLGDVCSNASIDNVLMAGKNIGDLLNEKKISWGWFEGGFDLSIVNSNGTTGCARSTVNAIPGYGNVPTADYIPHHQPFQYYASTQNPTHARPSSLWAVGKTYEQDGVTKDPANHQYDTAAFFAALTNGNLAAVSFLKAPAFQDAHPAYSDPVDEQSFLVETINAVMQSPFWDSTAIIITYDDSDGWYDHQMPPIVNPSFNTTSDALNAAGVCVLGVQQGRRPTATPLNGPLGKPVYGRCGYGTRIPMLVISPLVDSNIIDHTLTDQSSVLRLIEDNWLDGKRIQKGGSFDTIAGDLTHLFKSHAPESPEPASHRKLILDPNTGEVVGHH